MKPLRIPFLLWSFVGLLAAGDALTVDEAITLALANNERASIARERLLQADGARREAWADLLPELTARAGYQRSHPAGNSNQGTVNLALKIVDPVSFPRLRAALALYEANRLDADELKRALAFEVADAFAGVLAAESLVEAADKRLAVNDEALKQARLNVEAGLVARNELTRTEVEQATAAGALVKTRSAASRIRLSLGFLIGVHLDRPLALPGMPAEETPAASALISEARQRRQDLIALDQRRQAALHSAREPLMATLPRVDLVGAASAGQYLGGADEARYAQDDVPSWSLGLVATWKLYDGGARYGQAERLAATAREVELDQHAAQRRVALDVALALEDLATARATQATAEIRVQAAQRNQAETHARFTNGLATAIEEADATASTFEAAAERTRARYAMWQAWLAINRTVGRWPTSTER